MVGHGAGREVGKESPGIADGEPGVRLRRWHCSGGDAGAGCSGEAERQRGLLPPSLASAEELFRGKGFSFFLSKPALREDESFTAWVASCSAQGCGAWGGLCPVFAVIFWGRVFISMRYKCSPPPHLSRPGSSVCCRGTAPVGAGRSRHTKTLWRGPSHPEHGSPGTDSLGTGRDTCAMGNNLKNIDMLRQNKVLKR